MRWNWNVWTLKLPSIWTKRIQSHYLYSQYHFSNNPFPSFTSQFSSDRSYHSYHLWLSIFPPKDTHNLPFLSCGSPLTWHGRGIQDTPKTNPIVVDLESYPKGETLRGSSSNSLKRFSYARRKSTSCYNLVYVCPFCPWQSYEIGAIGLIINYIHLFGTLRNIRITWRK